MQPPVKSLNAPLLVTLTVVGCFFSLTAHGYGKACVRPATHTVFQQPTGEPDMDAPNAIAVAADVLGRRQ